MGRPRRDAGRPATVRRWARTRTGLRGPAPHQPALPGRAGPGLTSRAAILALVVVTVLVSAALPLREMLSQRSQIAAVQQQEAGQRRRIADLDKQRAQLDDPAYVTRLARERLHLQAPGQTAYIVLGAPQEAALPSRASTGASAPWYTQLYGGLQAADSPGRAASPPR